MVSHRRKLPKVKPGRGAAVEVFRARGEKPTRFRFKGVVMHKGKKMQQRLGFRGKTKVVEVAYVPIKSRRER